MATAKFMATSGVKPRIPHARSHLARLIGQRFTGAAPERAWRADKRQARRFRIRIFTRDFIALSHCICVRLLDSLRSRSLKQTFSVIEKSTPSTPDAMSEAPSDAIQRLPKVISEDSPPADGSLRYDRLKGPDEVRVIRLLPNPDLDAPIVADLEVVQLGKGSNYSALSYSWDGRFDDENLPDRVIKMNGVSHQIKGNLHAALRRLRKGASANTLWVDALCINQADVYERSVQVSLMHRIYSNATEVIVWLGEDSEFRDAETFFAFCAVLNRLRRQAERIRVSNMERALRQLARTMHQPVPSFVTLNGEAGERRRAMERDVDLAFRGLEHSLPLRAMQRRVQRLPVTPVRQLYLEAARLDCEAPFDGLVGMVRHFHTPLYNHLSRMVYIFSHRRYFTRRWILQEISSAKKLIFACGPWRVPWDDIRSACLMWAQPEFSHGHPGFDIQPLLRIFSSREKTSLDGGLRRLLLDMVAFHDYGCVDPRDKVYALLHLTDSPPLVSDYSLSASTIYLQVAYAAVNVGEACILLDTAAAQWSAHYDSREDSPSDGHNVFPSWIPDWHLPISISVPQPANALAATIVSSSILVIEAEYIGQLTSGGYVAVEGVECEPGRPDNPRKKEFFFEKTSDWAGDLLFRQERPRVGFEPVTIDSNCAHARGGDIICLSPAQSPGIETKFAWIFRVRNRTRDTYQVVGSCWVTDVSRFSYEGWRMQSRMRTLQIV